MQRIATCNKAGPFPLYNFIPASPQIPSLGSTKQLWRYFSKTKKQKLGNLIAHKLDFDLRASTQCFGRRHGEVHFSVAGMFHPHHSVCAYAKCVHTTFTPTIILQRILANVDPVTEDSHTQSYKKHTHVNISKFKKPQKKGPHDVIKPSE